MSIFLSIRSLYRSFYSFDHLSDVFHLSDPPVDPSVNPSIHFPIHLSDPFIDPFIHFLIDPPIDLIRYIHMTLLAILISIFFSIHPAIYPPESIPPWDPETAHHRFNCLIFDNCIATVGRVGVWDPAVGDRHLRNVPLSRNRPDGCLPHPRNRIQVLVKKPK